MCVVWQLIVGEMAIELCEVKVTVPFILIGSHRRCVNCRSRGELGSCKDPFTMNSTQIALEKGVEALPCVSGWCGKIIESQNLNNGELSSSYTCSNKNYSIIYIEIFCLQNMVPPRRDYASNEDQTITKRDAPIPCGITRKCTCAFVMEIFVTERRERQMSPVA